MDKQDLNLTETELEALKSRGWQPGQPLPDPPAPVDETENLMSWGQLSEEEQNEAIRHLQRRQGHTGEPAPAAETTSEAVPDLQAKAPEGFTECPQCGYDCRSKLVTPELTETDKLAFLASLSGGRFTKTYVLFRNTVEVTFRSLTSAEHREVISLVSEDDTPVQKANNYVDGWLSAQVVSLRIGNNEYAASGLTADRIASFRKFVSDKGSAVLQAVYRARTEFTSLYNRLSVSAFDPNF